MKFITLIANALVGILTIAVSTAILSPNLIDGENRQELKGDVGSTWIVADRDDDDDNNDNDRSGNNNIGSDQSCDDPSIDTGKATIEGTWICNSRYNRGGKVELKLSGDTVKDIFGQNEISYSFSHDKGPSNSDLGVRCNNGKLHTYYESENSAQRRNLSLYIEPKNFEEPGCYKSPLKKWNMEGKHAGIEYKVQNPSNCYVQIRSVISEFTNRPRSKVYRGTFTCYNVTIEHTNQPQDADDDNDDDDNGQGGQNNGQGGGNNAGGGQTMQPSDQGDDDDNDDNDDDDDDNDDDNDDDSTHDAAGNQGGGQNDQGGDDDDSKEDEGKEDKDEKKDDKDEKKEEKKEDKDEKKNEKDKKDEEKEDEEEQEKPVGCFTSDGTWTSNRNKCDEEQKFHHQQTQKLLSEAEDEDEVSEEKKLPKKVAQSIKKKSPPPPITEEEEVQVIEKLEKKYTTEEKARKKKGELIKAIDDASDRLKIIRKNIPDLPDYSKTFLTSNIQWLDGARDYIAETELSTKELKSIGKMVKEILENTESLVDYMQQAGDMPKKDEIKIEHILERIDHILDQFPQAFLLLQEEGIPVDHDATMTYFEAQMLFEEIRWECVSDESECEKMWDIIEAIEDMQEAIDDVITEREDIRDDVEELFE